MKKKKINKKIKKIRNKKFTPFNNYVAPYFFPQKINAAVCLFQILCNTIFRITIDQQLPKLVFIICSESDYYFSIFLPKFFLNLAFISTRCLMVSTDQADPSCFYFRIS